MTRVILLANQGKEQVVAMLPGIRDWLSQRAAIVFEDDACSEQPIHGVQADLAVVLGGDGTLLSQARRLIELDVALVGVNFGKLGFLAEFSLAEFQARWDQIIAADRQVSQRVALDVEVCPAGQSEVCHRSPAMNDCVVTAGRPFRMIRMELAINPADHTEGTRFAGDGVIVATPSGSTAYNVSAGGPILAPDVEALAITPICPHSLSFRPIVVHREDVIRITMHEANEGTTLVIDGQHTYALGPGSVIRLRAHDHKLHLIKNPDLAYWKRLARKMHWAASPVIR